MPYSLGVESSDVGSDLVGGGGVALYVGVQCPNFITKWTYNFKTEM